MTLASSPGGGAIVVYVLAGIAVLAAIAMVILFVLGRRPNGVAGTGDDQPTGAEPSAPPPVAPMAPSVAAPGDGASTAPSSAGPEPVPAIYDGSPAARLRRRDALPPIRVADAGDQVRLAEIEAQSDPGLDGSGLGVLPSSALRERDAPASVLLVAGRPAVAYIRVDEVDGNAHIDQLGVLPAVARRGIGNALIEAAIDWATRRGYRAMTLSTFAESDWNARVYDASGFTPVDALTPGLLELRDWERAIGLDAIGERVVLRRELPA